MAIFSSDIRSNSYENCYAITKRTFQRGKTATTASFQCVIRECWCMKYVPCLLFLLTFDFCRKMVKAAASQSGQTSPIHCFF